MYCTGSAASASNKINDGFGCPFWRDNHTIKNGMNDCPIRVRAGMVPTDRPTDQPSAVLCQIKSRHEHVCAPQQLDSLGRG